jgi:GxxExxY protein
VEENKGSHQFEVLSKKVIGAAIAVHKELGLENIYEEALKVEIDNQRIKSFFQKEIRVEYSGVVVGIHRLDLVVEKQIIVELKAIKELADIHFAQIRSYLKATGFKIGLLLNFAKPILEIRRIVN